MPTTRNFSFNKYLDDRRLGAGLEGVSQLAFATILTIFVESHLPGTGMRGVWMIKWL